MILPLKLKLGKIFTVSCVRNFQIHQILKLCIIFIIDLKFSHFENHQAEKLVKNLSFMLVNELQRFLSEIETDNLTVSNCEIITLDFTV